MALASTPPLYTINFDPKLRIDQGLYSTCIQYIAREYERAAGYGNIWRKGKVPFTINLQAAAYDSQLLACAWADSCTCMCIEDKGFLWLGANTSLQAHELAHIFVERYTGDRRQGNNLVHYAANAGWLLTKNVRTLRYGTIRIVMLDMARILAERDAMNIDIASGHAPNGKDKYWPA